MLFDFWKRPDINKGVEEYKSTEGAILLDVRTKEEYISGHIPQSINIDVGMIGNANSKIKDISTPVFVYCHSGARSSSALNALKGMGYTNVKNIGGIIAYSGKLERGV